MDARHACISKGPPPKINFTDYRDADETISAYSEADLIIIAAGQKLHPNEKAEYKKLDSTGRLGQSMANYDIIKNHCQLIKRANLSELPLVGMLSNNADHMTELARETLGNAYKVFGIGCLTDSLRIRSTLQKEFSLYDDTDRELLEQIHTAGLHGPNMIVLENNALVKLRRRHPEITDARLETCREKASRMGGTISAMQKPYAKSHDEDYGSYQTPAKISDVILALGGQREHIASFNWPLTPKLVHQLQQNYSQNISNPASLSFPVKISEKGIEPAKIEISDANKVELAKSIIQQNTDKY
jgi:malate/lactate dehydrogenase